MSAESRRQNELDLLTAMYPDELDYNAVAEEATFTDETRKSSLVLRLSPRYLIDELPIVVSAHGPPRSRDLRTELTNAMRKEQVQSGVEVLADIVLLFIDLVSHEHDLSQAQDDVQDSTKLRGDKHLSVVVWLHHLLNVSKRKQVLHPQGLLSGVSKPGYPGVLVFTGPAEAVREHVADLRRLNWQAFQVRLELPELWQLQHGSGDRGG